MYDVHGVCTPSRCISTLIHGWLGSHGQPRLPTNFWTRSWFAAADGWTRLPRKVTRWPSGNVRSRTLADAYGRWFPVRGFCSFRVWPCQTVPQCDWALRGNSTASNSWCSEVLILRSVRIERAISIVLIVDRGTAFPKNSVDPWIVTAPPFFYCFQSGLSSQKRVD